MICAGGGSKNAAIRSTTKKGAKTEANANDHQSEVDTSKTNSDEQLQLGGVDKLPPVDAPEASNISATRY